jgi:hypothetical protein
MIDALTKSKVRYEEHKNSVERAQKNLTGRESEVSDCEKKIALIQSRWEASTKPLTDGIGNIDKFIFKLPTLRQLLLKQNEKI